MLQRLFKILFWCKLSGRTTNFNSNTFLGGLRKRQPGVSGITGVRELIMGIDGVGVKLHGWGRISVPHDKLQYAV